MTCSDHGQHKKLIRKLFKFNNVYINGSLSSHRLGAA